MPNSTMRASGYHAAINTAILAGTIQRAPPAGRCFAVAAVFAAAAGVAAGARDALRSAGTTGCVSEAIVAPQKFFFRSMP
jgi:hypothetical protein